MPSGFAFAATSLLDHVEDMAALVGQERAQRDLAEFSPRGGADQLGELRVRDLRRSQRLVEAQGIDDAVARIGLHLEPLLIAHDRLLDRRLEQQRAGRRHIDRVDERRLELEARLVDDADRRAEPNDKRLLAFVDDIDRGDDQIERERDNGDRRQPTASHFAAPCAGAAGHRSRSGRRGGLNSVTGI